MNDLSPMIQMLRVIIFGWPELYQSSLSSAQSLRINHVAGRFYSPLNTLMCAITLRPKAWSS
jgi:hypothetical protein